MTKREAEILKWIEENPLISQNELADKANITRSSVAVHISNLIKKGKIIGKGYILKPQKNIIIIGGANVDIAGIPKGFLKEEDSNPGNIKYSLGGVGRNIAENLARLSQNVELITVLGNDPNGENIKNNCRDLNINLHNSLILPHANTSTYLFILDENKDMKVAISAMDIFNNLTVDFIKNKMDFINKASICILDTNPPQETIEYIANNCSIPLFVDCVSTNKAIKIKSILHKIHTLKPNKIEAEFLSGIKIIDDNSLEKAGEYFIKKGIKQIFISLGKDGVYYSNGSSKGKLSTYTTKVINSTGAGDAFMAGIAYGFINEENIIDSCKFGLKASAITLTSENTINENINLDILNNFKEDTK
ncbi:MAG: PfkB family carbohydrate kinase [Cetobacterium sp.]|nr:PfkB family carbohydrate kinase [Cetobacterium sp.]